MHVTATSPLVLRLVTVLSRRPPGPGARAGSPTVDVDRVTGDRGLRLSGRPPARSGRRAPGRRGPGAGETFNVNLNQGFTKSTGAAQCAETL